jgi:excisionase family DNA binding protein
MAENSNLLTVNEAALRLKLSVACLRAWIARRQIGFVRIGRRRIRIPESEITRMVDRGYVPPAPARG